MKVKESLNRVIEVLNSMILTLNQESPHLNQSLCSLSEGWFAIQKIELEEVYNSLMSPSEGPNNLAQYILFDWINDAKSFNLLFRDSILELTKANHLLRESKISAEYCLSHREEVRLSFQKACNEIQQTTQSLADAKALIPNPQWKYANNPWPEYKAQFELIESQIKQLADQSGPIFTLGCFENIRKEISKELGLKIEKLELDISQLSQYASKLKKPKGIEPKQLVKELAAFRVNLRALSFTQLRDNLKKIIAEAPLDITLPCGIQDGQLIVRHIKLSDQLNIWLDSEIFPLLSEIESEGLSVHNSFDHLSQNVESKFTLISQANSADPQGLYADLGQLSERILKETTLKSPLIEQIKNVAIQINEKLSKNLFLSNLYSSSGNILAVSFQSALRKLSDDQTALLERLSKWMFGNVLWFRDRYLGPERSSSEKMVEAIQKRTISVESLSYSTIFISQGYPGRAFYVPRDEAFERVSFNASNWKKGYSGSILLWGDRFCGKTSFGFQAARHHFGANVIKLMPNTDITINGRKEKLSHDLGEALNFISKAAESGRYAIWLDDLELWNSLESPRLLNVDSLINAVTVHGHRFFFMVGMSSWMKLRLDNLLQFSDLFQGVINLDRLGLAAITEAIGIRHSATQNQIIDKELIPIAPYQFRQKVKEIYNLSKGNIGEALRLWALASKVRVDHEVFVNPGEISAIPEMNDKEKSQLLHTILLERETSDKMIRNIYGPMFESVYRSELRRMLQIGMIERDDSGKLTCNPNIVNELDRYLKNSFSQLSSNHK